VPGRDALRLGFVTERLLTGFGVDLCVDHLAAGLAARGHDVRVYCAVEDGTYAGRGYDIVRIPIRASRAFPLMRRSAARWASFLDAEGLDALEIHTFPFFTLLEQLRTPTVAVDHGVSLTAGMPYWLRADFAYVRRRLYGRELPRATRLVTISDFLRRQMPAALAARATVIPWGAEHYAGAEPGAGAALRRRLDIPEDGLLSVYVGRVNPKGQPYKGVDELLAGHATLRREVPGAALLCVGVGTDADADELRARGAVPYLNAPAEDMPAVYAAADLFVTCSRWEGFGLPLLEAQQAGVASVAYAVGGHPEVALAGETAALVETPGEFVAEWRRLATDPTARRAMAARARRHAAGFTWARAVAAHEAELERAATARPAHQPQAGAAPRQSVSAVVVTYTPEREVLTACLDSLAASTSPPQEVVVVENTPGGGVAADVCAGRAGVRFHQNDANVGFAAAVNQGMAMCHGDLVLLLNPDATVERDAIERLLAASAARPGAAGFAPKMLFAHDHDIVDAVGTAIDAMGAAFNVGIGQPDIGQFDKAERVMGVCFGAALVRRDLMSRGSVGPLDSRFFMYYEDVDWSLRATLLGHDFWTVPDARVYHLHSATTRDLPHAFKYFLVERNLMRTVARCFEGRRVWRVLARRSAWHARNALRGHYPWTSLRVLANFWASALLYAPSRWRTQRRRRRPDAFVFALSRGDAPHFDPVTYAPAFDVATLEAMVARRARVSGDPRWQDAARWLGEDAPSDPAGATAALAERLGGLPGPLRRWAERGPASTPR